MSIAHSITLVARSLKFFVVASNLRHTLVFISILNWPRGDRSLFAPRGIVLVVLYSCIEIL